MILLPISPSKYFCWPTWKYVLKYKIFSGKYLLEMHYNSTVKQRSKLSRGRLVFFVKCTYPATWKTVWTWSGFQVIFHKRRSSYYTFFVHYIPNFSEISQSWKTGRPTLLIPIQLLFTYIPEYMPTFNISDTILWITVKLPHSLQNLLHFKGNINHITLTACGRDATQC